MKRYKLIMVLAVLMFFAMTNDVKAYCDNKELSALKREVYKVEYDYEFETSFSGHKYFPMMVNLINVSDNFYVEDSGGQSFYFDPKQSSTLTGPYSNGSKIVYSFYASQKTSCPGVKLYSKTYQLPYYNVYSDTVACESYPELDVCKRFFRNDYSEEEFEEIIEQYEKDIASGKVKAPKDLSSVDKAIALLKQYFYIPLALIVIVIMSVIFLIRKKNKKKIKIKLED